MKKMTSILAVLSCAVLTSLGMAAPANADVPNNGAWNRMVNLNSGMCAAVGNDSRAAGAGLIQFGCDGKYNKRFMAISAGGNVFSLQIRSTGQCVTPQAGADHAILVQQPCTSHSPLWAIEYAGNDSYQLRNLNSGLCMGVAWGMTYSGQPLDQATCGAFKGQTWRFTT